MDYARMMLETPEETMKRFERKRKLKEVLCEFGLKAHKVRLGDSTHFAFALATPTGTPIARPCSSDDLAECSQWLASKYPTHFFFDGPERQSVLASHGGELGSDIRFGTADTADSKALQGELLDATNCKNKDLYPTPTDLRSYERLYGSIRDAHPGLDVESRLHELHPSELRRLDNPPEDARHCERSSPLEIFVSPWDFPPPTDSPTTNKRPSSRGRTTGTDHDKPRDSSDRKPDRRSGGAHGHGHAHAHGHGHSHDPLKRSRETGQGGELHKDKDRAGSHGEHRHGRSERKDRSSIRRTLSTERPRSRTTRTRRNEGRGQNQTSKSDEGSGVCGQDVSTPTTGPPRENQMDLSSRMTVRLRNVEKWDCLKQAGPQLRGEKIMLESDAESRPQELSTPSLTVSGRLKRIDSSDVSLSPEPFNGWEGLVSARNLGVANGATRHSTLRAMGRVQQQYDPPEFIDDDPGGVNPGSREPEDDNPECNIVVPDPDLVHLGAKCEKTLAWKPSPLYQAPVAPAPEKSESSFDSVCTSANEQDYDDEACQREERALIRYLRLFADDKSWKEGFESADGLTCDVCNLGGKMKRVPDVKALVSHAKTMKRIKMAEHRGYARAICELMNFDVVALDQGVNGAVAKPASCKKPSDEIMVWPPVLVLENTRTEKGPDGLWKGVDEAELTEVLEVSLAHKATHTFRPICGKNGHKGRVLVEFPPSRQAWLDATTLHKQFKMNARGYTEWLAVKPRWRHPGDSATATLTDLGTDFVRLDDRGNPKRVLYGYLAEPRHMEVFDPGRKYVQSWKIVSRNIL